MCDDVFYHWTGRVIASLTLAPLGAFVKWAGQALGWVLVAIIGLLAFSIIPPAAALMDLPRIMKNAVYETMWGIKPLPGRGDSSRLGRALDIIQYIFQVLKEIILQLEQQDAAANAAVGYERV